MSIEETKKAIEVMRAYAEGKEIELKKFDDWVPTSEPLWNWGANNYRIKPQPHCEPYSDVSEIQKNKWVKVKDGDFMYQIVGIDTDDYGVLIGNNWYSMEELFKKFEYEDGTPCGKLVSE